ncbi:MAG: beta-hydroxyacyl-ACP dehydratase [Planctomycetes bacterium]|nr:beta-hydroxyacyl-ACP dehydratase [Planctomycetota bacterium]
MRWIWIDGFLEFESGKRARTVKNLSSAEDHYAQHFPGYPVMPAALILEGLAQTGGILAGEANQFREKVVLGKINKASFSREFTVGETLHYEVELVHIRPEGATASGKVLVNGICEGEAEIFFAHLDQARSRQAFGEGNFVFTGEMRHLLDQAKRAGAPKPSQS